MKQIYAPLVLAFIIFFNFSASAKILRVGYNGIQLSGVDFNNITAANAAASAGDTVQIYGNQNGEVNKKLVLIGFGYLFDKHPNLQAIGTSAPSSGYVSFRLGSEGSVMEGLKSDAYIYTSDITIRRCFGTVYLYNNERACNNIRVISSVVTYGAMYNSSSYNCTNFQVINSIITGGLNFYGSGSNGLIMNCVTSSSQIVGSLFNLTNASFLIKNCIIGGYNSSNINSVYENNVFEQGQPSQLPQGSNNIWGQSYANIFQRLGVTSNEPGYYGYSSFDENYYLLKAGSPAINAGVSGTGSATNCGIFGGEAAYVYKISGVPAVPAIYQITAPNAATTNPYNVTISVRSNN